MDHYSDLITDTLSKLINSILDMDERTKTGVSSALGIFLTLYSIHKIEVKIKELVQLILTFKLIYILLIVLVISILIYAVIKYDLYSVAIKYISENVELKHIFYGSILFLLLVTIGSQFIKNKPTENVTLKPFDSVNSINELNFKEENFGEFNKNFLKILSTLSKKHFVYEKINSTDSLKLKNKTKVLVANETMNGTNQIEMDILNDSLKLYKFLNNYFETNVIKESNLDSKQGKFGSLYDLWKFLIKIIIFSIINLIFIYMIIRALMWVLVENGSEKSFDDDNASALEMNFSQTSSIDKTDPADPVQDLESDNSSEISKKKFPYIKNQTNRLSPNRIIKKSMLKKALRMSNSFDGVYELDPSESLKENEKKISNSLVSIVKVNNVETKETNESEIISNTPEDLIQDEFNIEFFINWLTSDDICNEFNLQKEVDCDIPYILNELTTNMSLPITVNFKNY